MRLLPIWRSGLGYPTSISDDHPIDLVSMSIFQWIIVVLTPGTGLGSLVKLVASSVLAGRPARSLWLAFTGYKRRKFRSLRCFSSSPFLSHLSHLATTVSSARSSSSKPSTQQRPFSNTTQRQCLLLHLRRILTTPKAVVLLIVGCIFLPALSVSASVVLGR